MTDLSAPNPRMVHIDWRDFIRQLDNDYPLAPWERLDDASRFLLLEMVDAGLLEFTEEACPAALLYLFPDGPTVIHHLEPTDKGRNYAHEDQP